MVAVEANISPRHRLVEGVASDGRTVWASSVLDRTILVCRPPPRYKQRSCRPLARLPRGLYPLAISWDRTRGRLWVAADCRSGVPGIRPCHDGAVLALDRRGRVRLRMQPTVGAFHPGDISVSAGRVFASDSGSGLVLEIRDGGTVMEAVNRQEDGKSAQGTALTLDRRQLIVADYSLGIGRLDLAAGTTERLLREDGKPQRGIDGIARCGSIYYGIYNGSDDGALMQITPSAQGIAVKRAISSGLPDPTQIAFDGKRLLVITGSGWADLAKSGGARSEGAAIASIPLKADCTPDMN
jgi:hypothetical protein